MAQGRKLHPESEDFLNFLKQHGPPGGPHATPPSVEAFRETAKKVFSIDDYDLFQGSRFELFIPTSDPDYNIPIYVYQPSNKTSNPPVLIFFHGGGIVAGNRDCVDKQCKRFSDMTNCVVVNVEYRLYPEAGLLDPFDDGVWAAEWVKANLQLIGAGPQSKVGVGGESAGGRIAASVAHDVKNLAFQILIYANVGSYNDKFPSFTELSDGPIISKIMIDWFSKVSDNKFFDPHPRCSSLHRTDFEGLPPALFIVGDMDPLRDENYAYRKILQDNGVYTEMLALKGVIHAFNAYPGFYKENCKLSFQKTADFIIQFGSFVNNSAL